ncbi:hypothetical protein Tco_0445803 [Tanacetum coccineum]
MAQIIQCLGGKTGGFDQITNKDAIMLYSLANGIHIDYANIFWEDIILKLKKKQREKVVPYTRFLSLLIMHKMKEDYGIDEPVVFKAPKTSSRVESVSQGTKPGAKTRQKKPATSSKQPFVSNKEATKVSTLVDTEMHKDDQQATGGPTSLGVTSKLRAHPQLSSVDFIAEANPGLSAPNNSIPPQQVKGWKLSSLSLQQKREQAPLLYTVIKKRPPTAIHGDKEEASNTIKLEDLAKLVSQIQPSFKDLDSPEDDPVIIVDESDEDEPNAKTEDTSIPRSSSPSSLPTELKDLPSKINELTEEIKRLKTQVYELEIELPKELKEIPTKLEDFTKTATKSTSTKARDQSVPSAAQADTMPAEGEKDTNQATISQLFQRKAKKITEVEKENLNQQPKPTTPPTTTPINPPIITTTTQMQTPLQSPPRSSSQPEGEHIKKDKGKKGMSSEEAEKESTESDSDDEAHVIGSMVPLRRAESRITNCDVLTRKGPITFKVYREDGTYEVIPNFKVNDLHLGKWREVMKACPDRKGKGWQTIYDQIQTRMDYLHTTKAKLGINLDIPLSMQDPLDKLNDLANNKRKHANDIHDYFKATKVISSDFVTIEDLKDFSNVMLYTVQEIFFKRHQDLSVCSDTETEEGPWLELQFSLVDNSKLNVVYLLNRKVREKDCFMPKGIKQSPLEKVLLKSTEKYIHFSLKDCTWLKFKFEGDNTSIVIQPPCYSTSKSIIGTGFNSLLTVKLASGCLRVTNDASRLSDIGFGVG